jgi:hypothetical protein
MRVVGGLPSASPSPGSIRSGCRRSPGEGAQEKEAQTPPAPPEDIGAGFRVSRRSSLRIASGARPSGSRGRATRAGQRCRDGRRCRTMFFRSFRRTSPVPSILRRTRPAPLSMTSPAFLTGRAENHEHMSARLFVRVRIFLLSGRRRHRAETAPGCRARKKPFFYTLRRMMTAINAELIAASMHNSLREALDIIISPSLLSAESSSKLSPESHKNNLEGLCGAWQA